MQSLVRLFIAGINLVESEGRVLRDQVMRTVAGAAGILVAGTVFLLSLIAVLLAAFLAFREALGNAGALLTVSALGFTTTAILCWSLIKWLPINCQSESD